MSQPSNEMDSISHSLAEVSLDDPSETRFVAQNQSVLHLAAFEGHLDILRKLIVQQKLNIDSMDCEQNTPLLLAAIGGHEDVLQFLFENGANVNAPNSNLNTALHECAWRGYSRSLELLCRNHCKLQLKNQQGHTPLHLAAQKGHNQCCRVLLLSGCKPNVKNNFGDTALHSASRYGHVGVVRILISAFANVNELNKNDDTALHIAAAMGRKKLAKILLESGCNPTIVNKQGETPMNIALRKCFLDIQELIANPPPLKPIYWKQQQLYVQPIQSSYRDIYCAVPKSDSYGSTTAAPHRHHRREHRAARCKSDFSNAHLNPNTARSPSATSDKQCTSVSKYYSNMLLRQASPLDEPSGLYRQRSRDLHPDFPKPKLETLPSEPLAKGEQYYVDLSGHIHKGQIKCQVEKSGKSSKSHRHRFRSS